MIRGADEARARVSVMVFTLNEEIHLERCLAALSWSDDVIVIDSFSTDRTPEIAQQFSNTRFVQHTFEGFGSQRNWALDHALPKHQWILMLDADEVVPPALASELLRLAAQPDTTIGAYRLRRRFYFWGRWLRYSSLYPTWVVRFVHRERVRYVDRGHAETQTVQGIIGDIEHDLIDENLRGIDDWFARQNRYSRKDAEFERGALVQPVALGDLLSADPMHRRAALKRLAARIPCRGALYFLYSYVLRCGFLDGRDGFYFCRLRSMYQNEIELKKYDLLRRADSRIERRA